MAPLRASASERPQGALNDELVGAPEIEADHQDTGEQPRPRHQGVVGRADQVQCIRRCGRAHRLPTADRIPCQPRDQGAAADDECRLDGVVEHHRAEPAEEDVASCDQCRHPDGEPQRDRRKQRLHHHRTGVERRGSVDEDIGNQQKDGKGELRSAPEAPIQILRRGVELGSQQQRQHVEREEQQQQRRQPLIVEDRDAVVIATAGQRNEGAATHIGHIERQANDRPGHASTRQEIAFRTLLASLAGKPPPQHQPRTEHVADHDRDVDGMNLEARHRCSRLVLSASAGHDMGVPTA